MPARILIVEDDALVAASLESTFKAEGYCVDSVGSLSTAKARLAAQPGIDLMALDVALPDGNGLELFEDFEQLKAAIPVIIISALHSDDERLRAFDAGAADYVVKPFNLREVVARVNNILNVSKSHPER